MNNRHTTLVGGWREAWSDPGRAAQVALQDETHKLKYAELFNAVSRIAGGLRADGLRRGERVALAMDRSLDQLLAILAVQTAGGVPCPMEPRLAPEEFERRLRAANVTRVLDDARPLPSAPAHWDDGLQAEDAALLLFTSGSTGKPKGVLQSHRGLLANALGVIAHTGLTQDDRLLHVMPLYHTNGLNNQLFAPLLAGATVILAGRFRADDMPALLEAYRPTIITGVPTMYSRMLEQRFTAASLSSLRFARCGSAPITAELHRKVEALLGRPLLVSYGLSEATCTSAMNPPAARRIGTVGTVLAGQDVYLAGPEGTRLSKPGQEGEICIAGPSLMLGYLAVGDSSALQAPDGVIRTGDLGRFDTDGYLTITGRIKDVIIRGGENLSPGLIENVLAEHPEVGACCVVGMADDDLGEVPAAFVVPAAGAQPNADALSAFVAERLSRIYKPAAIFFTDTLPENAIGKFDRKALQQRLERMRIAAQAAP